MKLQDKIFREKGELLTLKEIKKDLKRSQSEI